MMLSERELELSGEHEGIMLLAGRAGAGHAAGRGAADRRRGARVRDHLEPAGLPVRCTASPARCPPSLDTDLAPVAGPRAGGDGRATVDDYVTARIDAPDLCPRWAARVFTDVKVGPSPPWLKARIAAAGMRPISNVVDITNYVMLCVGEPTHAFDLDKVAGREIIVRRAGDGERVITLDGQERDAGQPTCW